MGERSATETTVQIGCDTCPKRSIRRDHVPAFFLLAGLDTSGVPMRVDEEVQIPGGAVKMDVRLYSGDHSVVPVDGELKIQRKFRVDGDCSMAHCGFAERIAIVDAALNARIISNNTSEGQ